LAGLCRDATGATPAVVHASPVSSGPSGPASATSGGDDTSSVAVEADVPEPLPDGSEYKFGVAEVPRVEHDVTVDPGFFKSL
jgi:hypothetical protein